MNCKIVDNSLYLPIGTKFIITQKGITDKRVNIKSGDKHNEFVAIFDENDVDFEISCDNRECDRGIGLDLTVNETRYPFYIEPEEYWNIKALETNGRKLHLMSENTEWANAMIAQTATNYGISYELASISCSKIEFRVEFEQCLNKVIDNKLSNIDVCLIGTKIQIFVKTFTHKTLLINIGANNTVKDLKLIIAKREGIPFAEQIITYRERALPDNEELVVCGVTNECNIQLKARLLGGLKQRTAETDDSSLSDGHNTDSDTDFMSDSDHFEPNTSLSRNSGSSPLFNGERGVICYGERSNEEFSAYNGFKKDCDIIVNSFVIEMRMESRFNAI